MTFSPDQPEGWAVIQEQRRGDLPVAMSQHDVEIAIDQEVWVQIGWMDDDGKESDPRQVRQRDQVAHRSIWVASVHLGEQGLVE